MLTIGTLGPRRLSIRKLALRYLRTMEDEDQRACLEDFLLDVQDTSVKTYLLASRRFLIAWHCDHIIVFDGQCKWVEAVAPDRINQEP